MPSAISQKKMDKLIEWHVTDLKLADLNFLYLESEITHRTSLFFLKPMYKYSFVKEWKENLEWVLYEFWKPIREFFYFHYLPKLWFGF